MFADNFPTTWEYGRITIEQNNSSFFFIIRSRFDLFIKCCVCVFTWEKSPRMTLLKDTKANTINFNWNSWNVTKTNRKRGKNHRLKLANDLMSDELNINLLLVLSSYPNRWAYRIIFFRLAWMHLRFSSILLQVSASCCSSIQWFRNYIGISMNY